MTRRATYTARSGARLAHDAVSLLRPEGEALDLGTLARTFTIRDNDGLVEAAGARLVASVRAAAPGVRLRFAPKPDNGARALREGDADLEIGVLGESGPEIRIQALFRDRFVGLARVGHPMLDAPVTPARYAAFEHVAVSRRGVWSGRVDEAHAGLGLARAAVVAVPSFAAALALAAGSDLVALLPRSFLVARVAVGREPPFSTFELPLSVAGIAVSQMWHPRLYAGAGHRWLRDVVLETTAV